MEEKQEMNLVKDLETQKDLITEQIKKKNEEVELLKRQTLTVQSQIKAVVEKQDKPENFYADTIHELIKNSKKEIETLEKNLEKFAEADELNVKQKALSEVIGQLGIKFPKKLNPEYDYETKEEYWDAIIGLKKISIVGELRKFEQLTKQGEVAKARLLDQIKVHKEQIVDQEAKLKDMEEPK